MMFVCAVYDSAVQAYMRPIFVRGVGEALRSFTDEVNKGDGNVMNAHPDDFILFELGTFNDAEGSFNLHALPQLVVRGKDAVRSKE